MIVADASVLVEFLLGGPRGVVAAATLDGLEGEIHAPGLVDVEVTHAIRRLVLAGVLKEVRGRASVEILQDFPARRHGTTPLLPRIWQLRESLPAYDASYVALAEALACPLATFDAKLAETAQRFVEVVVPA